MHVCSFVRTPQCREPPLANADGKIGSSRAARIPLRVLAKPTWMLTTMVLHVLTSWSSRGMRSVGPSLGSFHLFDLCQVSA